MDGGKCVVLLAVNSKYVHSSLAVWLIAAGIERCVSVPHEVCVIEATIHQPCCEIADNVAAHKPDIIGISAYIWNARMLPDLLKRLRELLPDARIVLGGPEAEHNADYWLGQGADCVLPGAGETAFPAFLMQMAQGETPGETPGEAQGETPGEAQGETPGDMPGEAQGETQAGTQAQAQGKTCNEARGNRQAEAQGKTQKDEQEGTQCNSIFCGEAYYASLKGRIAYLETSRGCPFSCAYCLSGGTGVEYFPMETVKAQIRRLSDAQTKTIKLTDRTFNCNAARAYEILDFIISLDTNACFHFEAAADLFDERTLSLLAAAPPGRIQIEAGLQSFFEPALGAVSRKSDLEKAERNIKALRKNRNIHIHLDLIAGLPYETLADFTVSFDRAYALHAHTLQLGFLKLLHGSALRGDAESLGIVFAKQAPYEIISSPWLTTQDIQTLKHTENAIQNTFNKGRFMQTLDYVLAASRLRPFTFYNALGEAAPHKTTPLPDYAALIFDFCAALPNTELNMLKDTMTYDWLAMVKGKNKPACFATHDDRNKDLIKYAQQRLGHEVRREEVSILSTGTLLYVDSSDRDPVTGRYRVYEA